MGQLNETSKYVKEKCDGCGKEFEPGKVKYRKNYRKYFCVDCYREKIRSNRNQKNNQLGASIHSDERQAIRNINLYNLHPSGELAKMTSSYNWFVPLRF